MYGKLYFAGILIDLRP